MSQESKILAYLKAGNSITPMVALQKFGCFRLGARIHDLKQSGYAINCRRVKRNGKTFACYSLGA